MSRFRKFLAAGALAGALTTGIVGAAGAVSTQHPTVVSTNPANSTPHVLDGKILSIVQVGNRIVAGGSFTRVANASSPGTVFARSNIFAFDPTTGLIDQGFKPTLDKQVDAVAAAPDGTVIVGGSFLKVNGAASKGLAKLRLSDGARVTSFAARTNARVMDLVVRGQRVYLSGAFTSVNGAARSGLAAVDATSGALAGDLNVPFSGPRKGTMSVRKIDLTPNNRLLVAIGNFTSVGGQRRDQVAVLTLLTPDLKPTAATVNGWATSRYQPACAAAFDSYVHDVDIAADGRWFVIVTTGGSFPAPSLCDTAARWPLTSATGNQQPTWVTYTGGDTFWSAAITGPAVYVGGHFRWFRAPNPTQQDREGIAALDPATGRTLAWNPGRARGVGAFALYATPAGLWVGSDTSRIGGENHPRIAFLPL